MPKKKTEEKIIKEDIKEITTSEMLRSNFMPYAMSVIVSRAIPEIDGLKPSHRKILYTMYEMGLLNGIRTKSANIAARTMLLNPHGDASNYEAMVRLTQHNETLLTPIVDGKGSFGKHYSRDMAYAASRYTEAKLMPVAHEFFDSIRKNTVDFVDNYDSTRKEPVLLPVTFPSILANPTEGIAVGMASSIPSFNLNELCDATALRIQNPEQNIRSVMPGPDFTTGAYMLMDDSVMDKIYETGRGSIKMRAKYTVDKKNRVIEVIEIPYSTTAEAIIEGIIALIKNGKIKEINDVRNEIDLKGFKIAIDYKRGVDPDVLMQKLFKMTKLEDSYSCNITVLIDGRPREIGVIEVLDEWINWRRGCVKRELEYDLSKKSHDLHILEGLAKVLLDIDKAVSIIRNSETDKDVVSNLMSGFDIDEEQAEYIAEIKLRNLNREYIINRTAAIDSLKKEIAKLNRQLKSKKEVDKLIVSKLNEVKKKYGIERKTEIIEYTPNEEMSDITIEDYAVNIYRTKDGYIKKVPVSSLKNDPEIKIKEEDEIVKVLETTNAQEILFFTDRCNVYKIYAYTLKDSKPSDLGDFVNNVLELEDGEEIVYTCSSDEGKYVLIGFENGKVAKFPLDVYKTKQNRKKLVNAYSNISKPIGIFIISEDEEFGIKSSKDKLLIFNTKDVSLKTTKTTQGIQVLRLTKDAKAVCIQRIKKYKIKDKEKYGYKSLPASGAVC